MSEWRPIETAPKDGTNFIGLERPNAAAEMRWEAYAPEDAAEIGEDGYWSYTVAIMCDALEPPLPTHWMPLPPDPLP